MTWQEFTALLALATAMSFTPGPNTTLSTALAANRGLRGALPFVLAVPVGWGALLILSAAGLGTLLLAWPTLRLALQWAGLAYLLWLAFKLSQSSKLGSAQSGALTVGFWQGAALQFVNVKAWMLALTIVAGWIAGRDDALARMAVVLPVMLAYAFVSNFLYASAGALLRGWLASGRRLLWFNRAMALVLVSTVVWMAASH
ncbi:LysE family translocator [Hydrogenophaga defluvii]|uniref:LysE family translocator n=1 Tax=Hydrogenophaga defluvii TaxID=249410 RepID=A0ABW2SFB5_9BURK